MQLSFSRRRAARAAPRPSRRRPLKRRRLAFDVLEDRRLLSLNTTSPQPLTVDATGTASLVWDSPRAVAMDSAGDAVVAWGDRNPTTGNWNLMFQRYSDISGTLTAAGTAVTVASNVTAGNLGGGEEIMVARAPTTGDFVVVWGTGTNATSGHPYGTVSTNAQLYSSAGTAIGSPLVVGKGNNLPKSVAMDDSGFDVLYGALSQKSTPYTLTVQPYSYSSTSDAALGKPVSVVTTGTGDGNEFASMAMDGKGNFVVAWQGANSTTNTGNIDAERFTSAGTGQGVIQIASANLSLNQSVNYGDVAMDSAGNFVVAWLYQQPNTSTGSSEDYLYAQQFTTVGRAVEASPILVAQEVLDSNGHATSLPEGPISLAEQPDMLANGTANPDGSGAFDVSWTNGSAPGIGNIDAATYSGSGTVLQSFAVTNNVTSDSGPQYSSAAVDGNNDLLVVWNDIPPNASTGNVDGAFYLDPPSTATSSPTASSPAAAPATGGATTAATDAVFAAYGYPDDDDSLA